MDQATMGARPHLVWVCNIVRAARHEQRVETLIDLVHGVSLRTG